MTRTYNRHAYALSIEGTLFKQFNSLIVDFINNISKETEGAGAVQEEVSRALPHHRVWLPTGMICSHAVWKQHPLAQ